MLKVNKYNLKSIKTNKKLKILLIADIHLCDNYKKDILENIIKKVAKLKPSYICICGDIIDEFRYLDKKTNKDILLNFLNHLANISPTTITLGSHDYFNSRKHKTNNIANEAIKYWHNIIKNNNNQNLILLDNQIYESDDIRIIGYTPSREYFRSYENKEILISELNNNFKKTFKDNKYTILMCHTPRVLTKETLQKININSSIDLILSGHMHDGLVFPILKKLPTTIGFVSPQKTIFPKNTRGNKRIIINNHLINLIITGGIMKFSASAPIILQKFNFLYYNDIDLIEIDM